MSSLVILGLRLKSTEKIEKECWFFLKPNFYRIFMTFYQMFELEMKMGCLDFNKKEHRLCDHTYNHHNPLDLLL